MPCGGSSIDLSRSLSGGIDVPDFKVVDNRQLWKDLKLLARAVYVNDQNDICSELTVDPDYPAALKAVKELV